MNEFMSRKNEIVMPPICIGTWAWGSNWISNDVAPMSDLQEVFSNAVSNGFNSFDTAEVYAFGKSEKILGELISNSKEKVMVASKFNPKIPHLTNHKVRRGLKNSLKRLKLNKLDLYYIHLIEDKSNITKWVNQLGDVYEEGLTSAIGVSNYGREYFLRAYEILDKRGIPLSATQMHYSLLNREHEFSGLLEECKNLGVTFFGYMILAQGLLTGKYSKENPPMGKLRTKYYDTSTFDYINPVVSELKKIGEKYGKTPAQIALSWTISKGVLPIVGVRNAKQLTSNMGGIGWKLPDEDCERLDQMTENFNRNIIKVNWD